MPPRRSKMASGFASTVAGASSRCCSDWVSNVPAAKYISWFPDIGLDDRPKVGGKGGRRGEVHRAGIQVPPGFVVRTEAFEDFIDALERRSAVRARVEGLAAHELEGIGAVSRELRTRIEEAPPPPDLQREIAEAYGRLGEPGRSPA